MRSSASASARASPTAIASRDQLERKTERARNGRADNDPTTRDADDDNRVSTDFRLELTRQHLAGIRAVVEEKRRTELLEAPGHVSQPRTISVEPSAR